MTAITIAEQNENIFKGTLSQLLAVFAGTLVAVSDGMHYGWTAPVLPILLKPDSPIKINKYEGEWLETSVMVGAFVGLWITMYFVDRLGRKKSILLATFVAALVWVAIGLQLRVEYIFVARAFAGAAGNMAFVATPMYIAEIAEHKIRGFLSSLIYLMMLCGIILVYTVVPLTPFYVHCVIGVCLTCTQLIIFPFMPESPYYLIYKGESERAGNNLEWFRSKKVDISKELENIKDAVARQKTEKGNLKDLFTVPSNRKGFLIMTAMNFAQHFAGISVLLMNLHIILEAAGSIYLQPNSAAVLFSIMMVSSACTASICIDKYGRKTLLILSCILTAVCLLVIAVYFNLKNCGFDTIQISWIPTVCVMLYACCFKIGLGMVPIVLTAELFSTKMKAYGMTLADGCYIVASLLSILIYQRLTDSLGMEYPFYLFSIICLLTAVFTHLYIPETKGKTLEEIQMILKGKL
ncbi:facilitated trehalose transporter Tret1-like isoform X1 [Diorhabda carinulata]|uniref:facilitated trehalose transporter Tret1-like isoform X1 n=2 Tax=Diorhabda carinulata TaxID=1163345 RepID=UPI0025A289BE|nr:facilitated trehalose transporter Tret1-like isoform X1 [Diorhabda carinulata]XP_057666306.1 facilitated trehalose transporter Tret1-like isoform X1 [Diorhabda carinulata]